MKIKELIIKIRIWWFTRKLRKLIEKHDKGSLIPILRCPECFTLCVMHLNPGQIYCPVCNIIVEKEVVKND